MGFCRPLFHVINLKIVQHGADLSDGLVEVDVLLQEDALNPSCASVDAVIELVEQLVEDAEFTDVGEQLSYTKVAVAASADFLDSQRDAGELDHVLLLQKTEPEPMGKAPWVKKNTPHVKRMECWLDVPGDFQSAGCVTSHTCRRVCVNEVVCQIKVLQPEGAHVSEAHMPCHKVATGLSDTCKRLEALSIAQKPALEGKIHAAAGCRGP